MATKQLLEQIDATVNFLDELGERLDKWASGSIEGGWSTHLVEANRRAANECRAHASNLRLSAQRFEKGQ